MSLSFEQYNELLSKITDKGLFDYISVLAPTLVALATLYWSQKVFNKQTKMLKDEKLFTKDVDKIYEALDLLFKYSNAINLFYSLNEKVFNTALKGSKLEVNSSYTDKSSEEFYLAISDLKKASFLMKALGQEYISVNLDKYHSDAITLRKSILEGRKSLVEHDEETALSFLHTLIEGEGEVPSYAARVADLDQQFNGCIKSIVTYKEQLKQRSKM